MVLKQNTKLAEVLNKGGGSPRGLDIYREGLTNLPREITQIFINRYSLNEGFKKRLKLLDLSIQAGWLGSAQGQNPTKKNIVIKKNTKMVRMA